MAENSGFFDAHLVNGEYDRTYLAENFAKYFASFIGNGIFGGKSSELMVQQKETADMSVRVLSGQGWINGYWYENTDELSLAIDVADGVLNRIDIIVLRWDIVNRAIRLAVKKGTAASKASAPSIERSADRYELKLAEVYVKAGATNITQSSITDTRLNTEVCGLVVTVVDHLDTTEYGKQLDAFIEEFEISNIEKMNEVLARLNGMADSNDIASLILSIDNVNSRFTNNILNIENGGTGASSADKAKEKLGIDKVPNVATNDQTPTYTAASTLTTLVSGEKLSVSMGKIMKGISDLISHFANKSNPHEVTKSQVGLSNVPNVTTNNQSVTYTKASTLAELVSAESLSAAFGKISKAVSDLITHLASKSNPHNVTLSQVGAAAASHNHSVSDINSGTLGVARGGTGKSSNTANSVLVGNGTSAFKNISSASGAFYAESANGEPKFGILPVAQGGTGQSSLTALYNALGISSFSVDVVIKATDWDSNGYYTFSHAYITKNSAVELIPQQALTTLEQLQALQAAQIVGRVQSAGSIKLMCLGTIPTIDTTVTFIVRRDLI